MHNLGKYLLYTISAVSAGIGAGFLITKLLSNQTEKKIGGKLMHVHYRFSKDFDE